MHLGLELGNLLGHKSIPECGIPDLFMYQTILSKSFPKADISRCKGRMEGADEKTRYRRDESLATKR